MPKHRKPASARTAPEINRLRKRVGELEQTLEAIRGGQVDAVVVNSADGLSVYTLQGAEHPYRVMIESIREGAATLDVEGNVLYANERLSELLNIPLEDLIGAPLQSHVAEVDWTRIQPLVAEQRRPAACEVSISENTGTRRVLRISFSPSRGEGQDFICAVVTEVTELVEANEAQRITEQKLQTLSGRLLQLQDEERRHISRDLHDVSGQNLAALAIALSQLEAIMESKTEPEIKELLEQCRELAEQVSQEIRTLSYVLHPPLLEEVGLASAVRWYTNGFGQRTGIKVEINIASSLVRLSRDAEIALFRVLQEALTNVHRYSETKTVDVRVGLVEGRVALEVEDHGKGISAAILESRGLDVALGVGIQGMRERMRQLSGQLHITSRLGAGTKVVAAVPLSSNPDGSAPAEDIYKAEPGTKRVLIADDHEMLREGIRRVLQTEKDWIVCGEAVNGKEAIEKVNALNPDLVILDLSMPLLNGLDALRQIRKSRPQIKVLVFSVNNSEHVVREIRAAGADGYLCKSDAAHNLLSTLKNLFQNEGSMHASLGQA